MLVLLMLMNPQSAIYILEHGENYFGYSVSILGIQPSRFWLHIFWNADE